MRDTFDLRKFLAENRQSIGEYYYEDEEEEMFDTIDQLAGTAMENPAGNLDRSKAKKKRVDLDDLTDFEDYQLNEEENTNREYIREWLYKSWPNSDQLKNTAEIEAIISLYEKEWESTKQNYETIEDYFEDIERGQDWYSLDDIYSINENTHKSKKMKDNFDLRKFLVENKLTSLTARNLKKNSDFEEEEGYEKAPREIEYGIRSRNEGVNEMISYERLIELAQEAGKTVLDARDALIDLGVTNGRGEGVPLREVEAVLAEYDMTMQDIDGTEKQDWGEMDDYDEKYNPNDLSLDDDDELESLDETNNLQEKYGDPYFEDFEEAKKAAELDSKNGYVVHVNRQGEGYQFSDWFDADDTVASYENGRKLNENRKKSTAQHFRLERLSNRKYTNRK